MKFRVVFVCFLLFILPVSAVGCARFRPTEITVSEVSSSAVRTDTIPGYSYVIHTGTKKFHLPDCPSAARIKEENREESTESSDALIVRGLTPCRSCNP